MRGYSHALFMKYAISLALLLLAACTTTSTASPDPELATGVYEEINSNGGSGYNPRTYDLAQASYQAVRLLEQFVGEGRTDWTCIGTDRVSACLDRAKNRHAYVDKCTPDARPLEFTCEFGLEYFELGTLHITSTSYRYVFVDGSHALANPSTHTFEYTQSELADRISAR